MTYISALFWLALGILFGIALVLRASRAIVAENDELRAALRAIRWGHAGAGVALLRYIDRVLGDEAA